MAEEPPKLLEHIKPPGDAPAAEPLQSELAQKISMEMAVLQGQGRLKTHKAGVRWEFSSQADDPKSYEPPHTPYAVDAPLWFYAHDLRSKEPGATYWRAGEVITKKNNKDYSATIIGFLQGGKHVVILWREQPDKAFVGKNRTERADSNFVEEYLEGFCLSALHTPAAFLPADQIEKRYHEWVEHYGKMHASAVTPVEAPRPAAAGDHKRTRSTHDDARSETPPPRHAPHEPSAEFKALQQELHNVTKSLKTLQEEQEALKAKLGEMHGMLASAPDRQITHDLFGLVTTLVTQGNSKRGPEPPAPSAWAQPMQPSFSMPSAPAPPPSAAPPLAPAPALAYAPPMPAAAAAPPALDAGRLASLVASAVTQALQAPSQLH